MGSSLEHLTDVAREFSQARRARGSRVGWDLETPPLPAAEVGPLGTVAAKPRAAGTGTSTWAVGERRAPVPHSREQVGVSFWAPGGPSSLQGPLSPPFPSHSSDRHGGRR